MSNLLEYVYGIHVVHRLLQIKPENIIEIFAMTGREDKRVVEILSLAKQQGIVVRRAPNHELDAWTSQGNHQGVVARVLHTPLLTEHDLPNVVQNSSAAPLFLILDGIQDPHNLGACLRTADAAGATGVIVTKDKSASLTPLVRKVASGAAEAIPIIQVVNLVRALKALKTLGVWVMGASLNTSESLYHVDLKGAIAIVLGAEGQGLRRLTEQHCDRLMQIPMVGMAASLNVSVAAGVCLYESVRQRLREV